MTETITREPTDSMMIVTKVTEEPLEVDWTDIDVRICQDDWSGEAPWEVQDGYEHEFIREYWNEHEGVRDSAGWVNRSTRDGGSGLIEIDDNTIIGWGCDGYPGCSKQVRAETIARERRLALERLVRWYTDGWCVWCVVAEYNDFSDCVGGVYSDDSDQDYKYAEELGEELRAEVAGQLEDEGYVVTGKPDPPKPYSRIDSFKAQIRRDLDCSF